MASADAWSWLKKRMDALEKVENLNNADAKLFAAIVENVGPLNEWQGNTLTQMMSKHLVHHERLNLTFFLLGNRCPPDLYAEWLLSRNMLNDMKARNHIAGLIKDHKLGLLTRFTTYMLPFRVTAIPKPSFQRKHPFDGVGEALPPDSHWSRFQFPVETPLAMMKEEGWRWDKAYQQLTSNSLLGTFNLRDIKIHTVLDWDMDKPVETDMYGTPLDVYDHDLMDMQYVMTEDHASKRQRR